MYFVPQRINNSSDKEKNVVVCPVLADKSQLSEQQLPRSSCVSDRKSESLGLSTLEHLMVELYKIEKTKQIECILEEKEAQSSVEQYRIGMHNVTCTLHKDKTCSPR